MQFWFLHRGLGYTGRHSIVYVQGGLQPEHWDWQVNVGILMPINRQTSPGLLPVPNSEVLAPQIPAETINRQLLFYRTY
jgi:hypothetical protein